MADFTKYYRELKTFAYSLTKNVEAAEDLVQEVYLKAYTYLDSYTEQDQPKAWIFTIMRNTYINHYRRSKLFTEVPIELASHISHNETPIGYLHKKELEYCIEKLPTDFREVMELRLLGFKYEEIAEKMKLKIGTVKSRVFFARYKITQLLLTINFYNMTNPTTRIKEFVALCKKKLNSGTRMKDLEFETQLNAFQIRQIMKMTDEQISKWNPHSGTRFRIDSFVNKNSAPVEKTPSIQPEPARPLVRAKEEALERRRLEGKLDNPDQNKSNESEDFWVLLGKLYKFLPPGVRIHLTIDK
jgi:RNA polymerase sigma-70 factor (ECF subfamily)